MTELNSDPMTGTLAMVVLSQSNGQYVCQLSPPLNDSASSDIQCYGQTPAHAIAIALEQLAEHYRQLAEEQQNLDWDAVERSAWGEPIDKHYHVMLHYEDRIEAESKFEAMHNTIIGNTVVENAKITVIEIAAELPLEALTRSWR